MLNWIRSQQIVIIFICLTIICVCLPVMLYANANLPELVQRNVNDSLIILVEMQNESGDNYIEAKKDYAYLLLKFRGPMEERSCSFLLRLLYPELSPRKQLTSALDILIKSKDDQAKDDINEATEAMRQFVYKSQKFAGTQVSMSELHDLPEGLLNDAKSALYDSRECVEIYGNNPTVPNSQEACRKNRTATALAYLIRCVFQDFNTLDDELKQFRGDINRTIYYNNLLVKNNEDLLANDPLPNVRKQLEEDNGLLEKYTKRSNIRHIAAVVDRVPRSLVDFIVTEEGVFSTKDRIPEKKVLNKTRERNEG